MKKIITLSLLFSFLALQNTYSAEAMVKMRAKREREKTGEAASSGEPAKKKARVSKIKWADEQGQSLTEERFVLKESHRLEVEGEELPIPLDFEQKAIHKKLTEKDLQAIRLAHDLDISNAEGSDTETEEEDYEEGQVVVEKVTFGGMQLTLRRKDTDGFDT